MAVIPNVRRQGPVVLLAVLAYGAATIAFGMARNYWIAFLFFAATGASDTVSTVLRQTIRQLDPGPPARRMTSVNMMFFMGGPQLGARGGLVAHWFGAPISIISEASRASSPVIAMAIGAPQLRAYEERPRRAHRSRS